MKVFYIFLAIGFLALSGCKDEENIEPISQPSVQTTIPFTGVWERKFETRPGNFQTVNYVIDEDSIRYTLSGAVANVDYVILRDTFILEDNRFIGHTSADQSYLLFFKNISGDSLSLYKQEVASTAEALTINVPNDTTTQNNGWNRYHKK